MKYKLRRPNCDSARRVANDPRLEFTEKGILLYMVFAKGMDHEWTLEQIAAGGITYEIKATTISIDHLVEFGYVEVSL